MASPTSRSSSVSFLFVLMPMNDAAMAVVDRYQGPKRAIDLSPQRQLPYGWDHPAWLSLPDGRVWTYGIEISVPIAKQGGVAGGDDNDDNGGDQSQRIPLASIGRNGTIQANLPRIATKHCVFEYIRKSDLVVVRDESRDRTLRFYGEKIFQMEPTDRQKVVHKDFNRFIGFGGSRSDCLRFELFWSKVQSHNPTAVNAMASNSGSTNFSTFCPSVFEWDVSEHVTRIHLPRAFSFYLNCHTGEQIGQGTFASVFKAIDVDRATYMAVKVYNRRFSKPPDNVMDVDGREYAFDDRILAYVKKEVETLARIKHPNVAQILGLAQQMSGLGICMPLQEGTLENLLKSDKFTDIRLCRIACGVLQQMTSALAHIHGLGIAHFDVKPGNILYSTSKQSECGYRFSLTDFSLCGQPFQPNTLVGSVCFAAPEAHRIERLNDRSDIWSLYATIVWLLDFKKFRTTKHADDVRAIMAILQSSRIDPGFARIQNMAHPRPHLRPSAKDIRKTLFPHNSIEHAVALMQRDINEGAKLLRQSYIKQDGNKSELEDDDDDDDDAVI